MTDSNTPIVLVVCNDYGELALAMYLLDGQTLAENTTLMLPPRLHANNRDVLPDRTFVYESLDDIRKVMESRPPGILGLLSGYLLSVHHLCDPNELDSLLRSTHAQGWRCFTSDPFLGLLEEVEPSKLVTHSSVKWYNIWRSATMERKRLGRLLTEMNQVLKEVLHIYPVGESPIDPDGRTGQRLHFHNPAFLNQQSSASAPADDSRPQKWLFVLGDLDYTIQRGKYGRTFQMILMRKLHEALEAGRVPTLVAPAHILESVRKLSPVADAMELLGHCDYSNFQSLLKETEYVFYWNAVSFSCILRTLSGKPWFTFDEGHLLKGMNSDYANRISDWFYRGGGPPLIDISNALTLETLQQATQQHLQSMLRVQQGLLSSPDPQDLLSALSPQRSERPKGEHSSNG